MSLGISSDLAPGAVFPVFAKRHKGLGIPDWTFFVAKYFGSGVIIATAFIHVGCASYLERPSANGFHSCSRLPMRLWGMSASRVPLPSIPGLKALL